ncbi:hypothetical protein TYRP_016003 [Tyrophagus putrescentiae]|nr:hypothetical protein TYRP_016003 [Tyrophagus putrescentiae]
MKTVEACRCIGLPPPAYCRVDWSPLRRRAPQTTLRLSADRRFDPSSNFWRHIETGFTSAECGANLDVNSTYLIGGQFNGQEENYRPHIFTCHAFLQDWTLSGEKATRRLSELRKECEQFRAGNH